MKKKLLWILTLAALLAGQQAFATVQTGIRIQGFAKTISGTTYYAGAIESMWGGEQIPTQQGSSHTFNNATIAGITLNGTLNFQESTSVTDVVTGSSFTVTISKSDLWFYGATVQTKSGSNVSGCSTSVSSDKHTLTVTIPSGKTFGAIIADYVANPPMTSSNTTVTVPTGDYWVSNSDHKPKPEPTVVYGQTTLVKDTDYTLSWSNNSSAGTGTVTVTGKGNYTGSVSAHFNIRWARYYVHFDKNHDNATGSMSDQQFTYNTAQNLTDNAFSLGSYPFAGWSTTPNGAVTYTDGQSVSNLTAVDGETVTLYAQWTPPYTFNSTTGELTLNWGEFNKDNKWGSDVTPSAVTSVIATDEVSFTGDCYNLFYGFEHCTSMNLSNVNTDGLTNIRCMFWGCSSLTTLDLSSWNTAAVTEMISAFRGCTGLTSLNLTGWNTTSVTTMEYMFYECHNLATIGGISEWVTESVTNMYAMFYQGYHLQSLDLSGWNTAKVTNMDGMFYGCSSLQSLDLSGWGTAKVTNMNYMFYSCTKLATINVGEGWSTSDIYSSDDMFTGCTSLVGGRGTTYDENHTDAEYARIDRGPSSDQPGYLTGNNYFVESITVTPNEIYPTVGATYSIVFTVLPADATNPAVTFSTDDETVATVDANGTVTAVSAGTATITIAATDGSGVTGTLTVNVTNIDVEEITAQDITISAGQTATINYQVLPEQATNKAVTFTSANTSIATVDANGVVTGVGGGETTITIASVSNPDVTADVSVTVTEISGDHYQLFEGNIVEGDYLIVYNLKGKLYSMNNVISNHAFQYEVVNAIDNVITTDNADIVWHIAPNSDGNWTIYNAAIGKYAGGLAQSGAQLYDETDYCATWTVGSSYSFQNCDDRFLGFCTRGTTIIGFDVRDLYTNLLLYKKVEAPTETYTFDMTASATLLGETKYVATFYQSTYDYQLPAGALAYTASLDGGKVVFHRIGEDSDIIPANTAVIIVADASAITEGKITLTKLDSSSGVTAHTGNILQGRNTPVTVSNGQIDGKTVYVLGLDSNGTLGFYPYSSYYIPAGKAYYVVQ